MKSFVSSVGRSYFVRTRFTLYDKPASQTQHGTLVTLILIYSSYILLYMTIYFQNIHYLISPIFKCMYLFMSFSKLHVQSESPQQKRHDRFSLNSCQQQLRLILRQPQRDFLYNLRSIHILYKISGHSIWPSEKYNYMNKSV